MILGMHFNQHCLDQVDGIEIQCRICGQRFDHPPIPACPGAWVYGRANQPPELQSYRQLEQELLRPRDICRPDGMLLVAIARGDKPAVYRALYKREEARPSEPKRNKAGNAGERIVAMKRQKYTCTQCGTFRNDWRWLRQIESGRCAACRAASCRRQ